MSSLHGSLAFPFSQMVQNTIYVHGLSFALDYYCAKHGMSIREFGIFAGVTVDVVCA